MRSALLALVLSSALYASAADEDDWGAPPPGPPAAAREAAAPAARKIQLLKLRANGMYRMRKYREACDLYAACARLDSGDADARNDMAACYQKLGRGDSALASARAALGLAGRGLGATDTGSWSFRDLRARKNAYFVLDKLGAPMNPPGPGRCETWTPSQGKCRARLHVCAERGGRPAPGGMLRWDVLRAGLSRLNALFGYEEAGIAAEVPRPETRDMEELSPDGTPESRSRWLNRDSSVTLPLGEFLESGDSACAGPACGGLERELRECRILHFDPCAGVIGAACAIQEENGRDRIVIGEYYLIPSR